MISSSMEGYNMFLMIQKWFMMTHHIGVGNRGALGAGAPLVFSTFPCYMTMMTVSIFAQNLSQNFLGEHAPGLP